MHTLLIKINTAFSLGIHHVISVIIYRLQSRTGYFIKRLPQKELICSPPFFDASEKNQPVSISKKAIQKLLHRADLMLEGKFCFFSHANKKTGSPPDWFINPFTHKRHQNPSVYWSHKEALDNSIGDIKIIWEMSRMDWALTLSRAYMISGKKIYLDSLNHWMNDWIKNNSPQTGPNWICGQETAIRLIHIMLSAHLLSPKKISSALIDFIYAHCKRIRCTHHYAKAQQNNHATSEAAGLFIGGACLQAYSNDTEKKIMGIRWQKKGRIWLEKAVQQLIASDGSFAQHSLNYHRVLISTLNMVEYFRIVFEQKKFSNGFYQKVSSAVLWMYQMVDPASGQGPNLGANDGARLYVLSETSYLDYRPDIQLAACLFLNKRVYQDGPWNEFFAWSGINPDQYPLDSMHRTSCVMADGGYVTFSYDYLNQHKTWAMIRCPTKRFRPHHADALHFDFWLNGSNILCDTGSYSYDENETLRPYFVSSSAHNTVAFDRHDQMPVLSRFLFGKWLKTDIIKPLIDHSDHHMVWCGAYSDYKGCRHQRQISTDGHTWQIIDDLNGFKQQAIIRWHLKDYPWKLEGNCLKSDEIVLHIKAKVNFNARLTQGLKSLYYMKKEIIPVLEICVTESPAKIYCQISVI